MFNLDALRTAFVAGAETGAAEDGSQFKQWLDEWRGLVADEVGVGSELLIPDPQELAEWRTLLERLHAKADLKLRSGPVGADPWQRNCLAGMIAFIKELQDG